MYLNPTQLPQHLRQDYNNVANAYKKLLDDVQEYQTSLLPRYVSIPQWCFENEIEMSYPEMKELAELAREESLRNGKPIKMGSTPIGTLYCFYEDMLFLAFEEMTDPEEDEDE